MSIACRLLVCLALVASVSGHAFVHPLSEIGRHMVDRRDTAIHIDASTHLLESSGSWLTVSWSGVSDPSPSDWIAVYSPAVHNAQNLTSPAKYQWANYSAAHMETGSGSLQFRLVNTRTSYSFVLFRNGLKKPEFAASSEDVTFQNPNEILQMHVFLATMKDSKDVAVGVQFNTRDVGSTVVQWGTSASELSRKTEPVTTTYTAEEMCGSPAADWGWLDPGQFHTATLGPLEANTRYYYRAGDDAFGWSDVRSFLTPPAVGSEAPFNFIAYGDLGFGQQDGSLQHWGEQPSLNTTDMIGARLEPDDIHLVLHIGDISYAVGYMVQWDEFQNQITDIASRTIYMTCEGNHERDWLTNSFFENTDSGGECGIPYYRRFPMPRKSDTTPYYSFDYGLVHFVVFSTEHNFTVGSPQHLWVEEDLRSVDRTRTPWLIVTGHRPAYVDSSYTGPDPSADQPVAKLLRESFEDLWQEHGVDLLLWGHNHSYQRTCPVYRETCRDNLPSGKATAPVHLVIGMAGAILTDTLVHPAPQWIEYVNAHEFGFTQFAVSPNELSVQFIGNTDGLVRDSFKLVR